MDTKLMTVGDILALALEKEKAALYFYSELLNQTKIEEVRDLAAFLKDEENKHVRLIERRIAELSVGRSLPKP
jgi:rubrerythrin